MNIIVCVKHVPETAEAELSIDDAKKDVKKEGLVFDINEWDEYAIEEALLIKERLGGYVTVITAGGEESEQTLRKCLAKGADEAVRITDKAFERSDAYVMARILHRAILARKFDLVFTGVQTSDESSALVGPVLAQLLGISCATLVKKIEISGNKIKVHRELEAGFEEMLELTLPAVLTIQTGINEPRYVSVAGIRKAAQREIKVLGLKDLDLKEDEVGEAGSWTRIVEMSVPPPTKAVQILKGGPEEVSGRIVEILKERGVA